MTSFLEELWNSIFTPGPTPTLLYATNIAFGALLTLLITLLIVTWSIHFLILSFLSFGLWGAINWFANEVRQAQPEEDQTLMKGSRSSSKKAESSQDPTGDVMDSGDDTETEIEERQRQRETTPQVSAPTTTSAIGGTSNQAASTSQRSAFTATRSGYLTPNVDKSLRQRQRQSIAESTGSLSTDSEWEKVDDGEET